MPREGRFDKRTARAPSHPTWITAKPGRDTTKSPQLLGVSTETQLWRHTDLSSSRGAAECLAVGSRHATRLREPRFPHLYVGKSTRRARDGSEDSWGHPRKELSV